MNAVGCILKDSVVALCPDVERETAQTTQLEYSESELWHSLLTCVLSSQVSFQLAESAANVTLEVLETTMGDEEFLADTLAAVLAAPLPCGRRYRFPNSRASQIAATRWRFVERELSLAELINESQPDCNLRARLIALVDGLGPKQASMFLRDIGRSMDLAILDRHVLLFMDLLGLAPMPTRGLDWGAYLRHEAVFADFAHSLGHSVGHVDWAVWIVMRAAKREGLV
ncbi:hypothetical protein [Desulfovibrio aminophilus]|uniref:8-oxoguanine DNA glycosylase n=1 Tax=Desulfovibrio aminophilus TaxID=81425 RepID=UPI0033973CE9